MVQKIEISVEMLHVDLSEKLVVYVDISAEMMMNVLNLLSSAKLW